MSLAYHVLSNLSRKRDIPVIRVLYSISIRALAAFGKFGLKLKIKIGSKWILVNADHSAVGWHLTAPLMNWNLARIASQIDDKLTIVDVGANVGDTYAILRSANSKTHPLLLIEGGNESLSFLRRNTEGDALVSIAECFVGINKSFQFHGTSSSGMLIPDAQGNTNNLKSLDLIIEEKCKTTVGLIKVDTDGLDTIVIRSGKSTLEKDKPIVFIEVQPYHLMRNDNFRNFLEWMADIGYDDLLCWDNMGRYICRLFIDDPIIYQLVAYFHGAPRFGFLDVAFIHSSRRRLADSLEETERATVAQQFKQFESVAKNSINAIF
jgi:FkbM family methyltransferase